MRKIDAIEKKIEEFKKNSQAQYRGIIEPDTSITFENAKEKWNLTNSFLKLRPYQQDAHDALFNKGFKRFYFAWSRRLGKEVTSWSMLIKYALRNRCTAVVIYPDSKQGSRILWEGKMTNNGTTTDFLDFLPPFIDRRKALNHTVKRIDLPNGSDIWLLGAENYDKLRGINPQIVMMSEHAFQDPQAYRTIRPIIAENDGVIIIQTTWDGRNHSYKLWDRIKDNPDWYTSFLTAETAVDENGERYITEESIQSIRDEGSMPEYFIQQEFFMSVQGDDEKYYFTSTLDKMKETGQFGKQLWVPAKPIFTFWDIGVNDATAIIVVQFVDNKPRIIKYFETQGKTYEHDIDAITRWRTERNLSIGKHYLPHDGKNRGKMNLGDEAQNAQTYISQSLGEPCEAIARVKDKIYGVKLVRSFLPACKIDTVECSRLIECLEAHTKIFDETRQVYSDDTKHDWTSHAVKAIQTMCLAIYNKRVSEYSQQSSMSYMRGLGGNH